jgi:hypothetical protein
MAMRNRFAVVAPELRTLDGIVFASKKEMTRYAELKIGVRANIISDLELQPKFPVFLKSKDGAKEALFCTYTADFRYKKGGVEVIEELKSSGTAKDAAYRLRKKAAELYYNMKISVLVK